MSFLSYQGAGHRRIGALRSLWAFTLGAFLSGCFRNVPVAQPAQLAAGSQVRIQLTLDGTQQLTRQLGPEVRSVLGKVESVRNDTIYITLEESRTLNGQILPSSGSRVGIPRSTVAEMSERVRNKRRSVVAAIVAMGSAIALVILASGAIGGGGQDGTTPPPPPPT
ncbi:MAG: hypothetical protein IPK85_14470 [Gemmatimonadetes bacterium]|nr:hypothetical protein [Gemmatimonadota bacterium]